MMISDVLIDLLELSLNFFLNAMFHRFSIDEVIHQFLICVHSCVNGSLLSRVHVRAEHY